MSLNETDSLILSYCKGYLGFDKSLIKRLFLHIFNINEHILGYDCEIAYCLLSKEFYRVLKTLEPTAELSAIVFDDLRVGYLYPEQQPFFKSLFEKLRGRLCQIPLTDINFEKKSKI